MKSRWYCLAPWTPRTTLQRWTRATGTFAWRNLLLSLTGRYSTTYRTTSSQARKQETVSSRGQTLLQWSVVCLSLWQVIYYLAWWQVIFKVLCSQTCQRCCDFVSLQVLSCFLAMLFALMRFSIGCIGCGNGSPYEDGSVSMHCIILQRFSISFYVTSLIYIWPIVVIGNLY